MKKFLTVFMVILFVFSFAVLANASTDDISVLVDGEKVTFDVPPSLINGRTMVPLRAIFEALGATVEWDGATSTATATRGETVVKLTIGAETMYVNGEGKKLDAPGTIVSGRTLVPLRAVSEAFACGVSWDGPTRMASIVSDPDNYTVLFTPDGRSMLFSNSMVESQISAGWSKEPMMILYTLDGRSEAFPSSKVAAQLGAGWYKEPMTTLYTADGRSQLFPTSKVEAQLSVGWLKEEPKVTLYTADGRSQEFPVSKVAAQLAVGWYRFDDIFTYYYSVDGRVYADTKDEDTYHLNTTHGFWPERPSIFDDDSGYSDYFIKSEGSDSYSVLDGYDKQKGWIYHEDIWGYTYLYILNYDSVSVSSFNYFDYDKPDPPGMLEYAEDVSTLYIGYGPTSIGSHTFSDFTWLHRVEIAPSVKSIGAYAFSGSQYLEQVSIPASVTSIDEFAFGMNYPNTIYCEAGSYAETYAKNHGINVVYATPIYSLDGRSIMVTDSELDTYLSHGWYNELMTTVYADDGRTAVIPLGKVNEYVSVGWHKNKGEVYTMMYSLDYRTQLVLNSKIAENQSVGWYLWVDLICAFADSYIEQGYYEEALDSYIIPYLYDNDSLTDYERIQLTKKRDVILQEMRNAYGSPIIISEIEFYPHRSNAYYDWMETNYVRFSVRNLSTKTIDSLSVGYTCYDMSGRPASPHLFTNTYSQDTIEFREGGKYHVRPGESWYVEFRFSGYERLSDIDFNFLTINYTDYSKWSFN